MYFRTFSIDMNVDLAMPILRRRSCWHLPSDVNRLPRYMNLLTWTRRLYCSIHSPMKILFISRDQSSPLEKKTYPMRITW